VTRVRRRERSQLLILWIRLQHENSYYELLYIYVVRVHRFFVAGIAGNDKVEVETVEQKVCSNCILLCYFVILFVNLDSVSCVNLQPGVCVKKEE